MAKIFYLFLLLLISGGLYAQSDSTRPPETQTVKLPDTTKPAMRHDSTVKHLSHRDSVRRDSINRAHRAIRDSLARVRQAAHADSVAKGLIPGSGSGGVSGNGGVGVAAGGGGVGN